jgi:hypothetical protein
MKFSLSYDFFLPTERESHRTTFPVRKGIMVDMPKILSNDNGGMGPGCGLQWFSPDQEL